MKIRLVFCFFIYMQMKFLQHITLSLLCLRTVVSFYTPLLPRFSIGTPMDFRRRMTIGVTVPRTSKSLFMRRKDNVVDVTSNNIKKTSYLSKSDNQQKYIDALNSNKYSLIFAVGPAGTGKTLFACIHAIHEYKRKAIKKIILTRPVVTVDEEIGFLPGSINDKMGPWTRPIFDVFLEFMSQRELDMMIQNGALEICPLAYMRGRTFKNAFIVADEMQNSSPSQMLMAVTRIGENSKMIVTGDLKQSDRTGENGLNHFLNKFSEFRNHGGDANAMVAGGEEEATSEEGDLRGGITVCFLENKDIKRSAVVSNILNVLSFTPFGALEGMSKETEGSSAGEETTKKTDDDSDCEDLCSLEDVVPPKKDFHVLPVFYNTTAVKGFEDAALIPNHTLPKNAF